MAERRRILYEMPGMYGPVYTKEKTTRIFFTWHADFDKLGLFGERALVHIEFECQRRKGVSEGMIGAWKSPTEKGIWMSHFLIPNPGVWYKQRACIWLEDTHGYYIEFTCRSDGGLPECDLLFKHLVIYEAAEESYFDKCNAACILFEVVGDKFGSIVQLLEDVGDKFEALWVVGDQIQTFFYALGIPFTQAQETFYQLDEWCEDLCFHVARGFNLNDLLTTLAGMFPILRESVFSLKEEITKGLEEAFHIKEMWDWVTNADEWVKGKIGEGVTFTADAIADIFEDILDKVFKR